MKMQATGHVLFSWCYYYRGMLLTKKTWYCLQIYGIWVFVERVFAIPFSSHLSNVELSLNTSLPLTTFLELDVRADWTRLELMVSNSIG
jgi:hypothetical protein